MAPIRYYDAGVFPYSLSDYPYPEYCLFPPSPTTPSYYLYPTESPPTTPTYPPPSPPRSPRKSNVPPETIASYIAGPDPDSKYICLFKNCEKRFGRKYNIQSHIQTHLADRPYSCDVCKAGFVRHHDLTRHTRIHSPEKPYKCPCSKAFSRIDALARHKQRRITPLCLV